MTLHEHHYFEVRCDLNVARYCHKSFAEATRKAALAGALDAGFVVLPDGRHVCPMCNNEARMRRIEAKAKQRKEEG